MKTTILLAAVLVLAAMVVSAAVPQTMSYQGVLRDAAGNPVADGSYQFTFRLYNVASGGSALWTETQTLAVADGILNATLGAVTPLSLAFDAQYWLGISVSGGAELTPRVQLTSAPYALRAGTVEIASDGDWEFLGDDIYRIQGSVGIGASPALKADASKTPEGRIEAAGRGQTKLYVEGVDQTTVYVTTNVNTDGTDGQASVHGLRISQLTDPGIGYGPGQSNAGVKGYNVWGDSYSFGVAGHSWLDNPMSGAVLGADEDQTWAALAYKDAAQVRWGVYTDNNVRVGGAVHTNGIVMSPGSAQGYVLTSDASGTASWQPATGGGFTLPYDGSVSSASAGFRVTNTGAADGIQGRAATTYGVTGTNTASSNYASLGGNTVALKAYHNASGNYAELGRSDRAVFGQATVASDGIAVYSIYSSGPGNVGYLGSVGYGVYGSHWTGTYGYLGAAGVGVCGYAASGNAGYFNGNVFTSGLTNTNTFRMTNGAGAGRVMVSDASGNGSWQLPSSVPDGDWVVSGSDMYSGVSGNVGIGTTTPGTKLAVVGTGSLTTSLEGNALSVTNTIEGQQDIGVYAEATVAVKAQNRRHANNWARLGVPLYGIEARADAGATGAAIYGWDVTADGVGLYGFGGYAGVEGTGGISGVNGVVGYGQYGLRGTGTYVGLYAETYDIPSGWAAYLIGDLFLDGGIYYGAALNAIDHPEDPENRLLEHAAVEAPELLLLYRGKAQLDGNGEATVLLPSYFAALTKEDEATVTLTPMGRPVGGVMPAASYEWDPSGESFRVYGDPGREVSWVVMAERDDAAARAHPVVVEQDKGPGAVCEKGLLMDPAAYGYPESRGVSYPESRSHAEAMAARRAARAAAQVSE